MLQGPAGAKGDKGERVSLHTHATDAVHGPNVIIMAFLFSNAPQGDVQTQAAVRAIARQVCEQLIQSESSAVLCFAVNMTSDLPWWNLTQTTFLSCRYRPLVSL